jgi:hypothetical protein
MNKEVEIIIGDVGFEAKVYSVETKYVPLFGGYSFCISLYLLPPKG